MYLFVICNLLLRLHKNIITEILEELVEILIVPKSGKIKSKGYTFYEGKFYICPLHELPHRRFSMASIINGGTLIDRFKITSFSVRFFYLIDVWDMIVKQFYSKKLSHKNLI